MEAIKMTKLVAMALGMFLAILIMPGIGWAQGTTFVVQGTIQAVDCQTNTLTLNAADGSHVFPAAPNTAVFVDSASASFCTLQQYVGSKATVWVTANGNQLIAGRVDVTIAIVPGVPEPFPSYWDYGPYYGPYLYGPNLGIIVGPGIHGGFHNGGPWFHRGEFHHGDFHHTTAPIMPSSIMGALRESLDGSLLTRNHNGALSLDSCLVIDRGPS
jgi:hypothetical protein